MIIIDYRKPRHTEIIHACVKALKQGKIVAYPTDTSYGLAADATNIQAIKKLYKIKQRQARKPIHIVLPSLSYAKSLARWNRLANGLAKKFWFGPLTLVLPLKTKDKGLTMLSASTRAIGLRMPKNKIALDLAKYLKRPITATSANPSAQKSAGYDSYCAADVLNQFKNKKYKPDIIIDSGKLPRQRPSTIVQIKNNLIKILRPGPVSETQIKQSASYWQQAK